MSESTETGKIKKKIGNISLFKPYRKIIKIILGQNVFRKSYFSVTQIFFPGTQQWSSGVLEIPILVEI